MKKTILILSAIAILFSCTKENHFIEDEHSNDETCGTTLDVYAFEGTIKDSANNNLAGYTIYQDHNYSSLNYALDTISDSTYFIQTHIAFEIFHVRNASNVLVDSFYIPNSRWTTNDTVSYDIVF